MYLCMYFVYLVYYNRFHLTECLNIIGQTFFITMSEIDLNLHLIYPFTFIHTHFKHSNHTIFSNTKIIHLCKAFLSSLLYVTVSGLLAGNMQKKKKERKDFGRKNFPFYNSHCVAYFKLCVSIVTKRLLTLPGSTIIYCLV